ncbi:hypothetical protein ACSBR2_017739 [Camellia fascicularis]
METKDLVSDVLGSEGNTNSSILNRERGNELSGLSGSYGAFSPKSLKLSEQELETLVVLAKNSEKKVRGVTAKSIQEIFDRLAAIKARSAMEEDHQTSRPSVRSTLADLSTPLFQSAKWSDRVEGEQRSKLLDLPDSVEVTKTRGIAHQHGAIVEMMEKSSTSPFVSKEMGTLDMGDQALDADESGADGSPRGIESQNDLLSEESDPNRRGFEGNTRGGFQSRGRGTNTNNRGGHGGRGQYRAPEGRLKANVASASVRSEWHRMMKLSKEDKKTIPIWVKFYNIPLEYWDGDCLSRIASAVGVPLFMDQLTSSGSKISFARVCVDIPADSAFPDSFVITSGDVSINIHVEYQGVPS